MKQHYMTDKTTDNTTAKELRRFSRNGGMILRKLIEYIPVMLLTNLVLLLIAAVVIIFVGRRMLRL